MGGNDPERPLSSICTKGAKVTRLREDLQKFPAESPKDSQQGLQNNGFRMAQKPERPHQPGSNARQSSQGMGQVRQRVARLRFIVKLERRGKQRKRRRGGTNTHGHLQLVPTSTWNRFRPHPDGNTDLQPTAMVEVHSNPSREDVSQSPPSPERKVASQRKKPSEVSDSTENHSEADQRARRSTGKPQHHLQGLPR